MSKFVFIRKYLFCAPFLALPLLLASCQKPNNSQPTPSGSYQHGVWFIDEGNFGEGNARLDFYHTDKDTLETNVFQKINGKPLGDVFQSMYHFNGSYFLVANNSNDILVADDQSLKVTHVVPNIVYPRYILPVSSQKAYITDNTGEAIHVMDLQKFTVYEDILYNPKPSPDSAWAGWTEQMAQIGNKVYVAAVKTGKVLAINTNDDKIEDTISLSIGAEDIVVDNQKRLWVLCDGQYANPFIHSMLYCIDSTGKVLQDHVFPDISTEPGNLTMNSNGDTLYYVYGGIYRMGINQNNLPQNPLISGNGHNFYGLGIAPNGHIYAGDALYFRAPGLVFDYNSTGSLQKIHQTGIGPNGFLFVK